ncbi:MAG: hypothetical protein ACOZCL_08605 [Bacillota bacterium]
MIRKIEQSKKEKVKEPKLPVSKYAIKILDDIDHDQLARECKICKRLKFNKGSCGGRKGQNICLAFVESPVAKLRENALRY